MGEIANLIARCRSGDDAAQAEFFNRFQPFISYAVARQLRTLNVYHSKTDIDDLTSETVLKIAENDYEKLDSLRDPDSINGWLFVVARNLVTSHIRRQARADKALERFAREPETPYSSTRPQPLKSEEQQSRLYDSLEKLSDEDRLIVTPYYIENLKYYEIADMLSLNINTVATRLRRAKLQLRANLLSLKNDI